MLKYKKQEIYMKLIGHMIKLWKTSQSMHQPSSFKI